MSGRQNDSVPVMDRQTEPCFHQISLLDRCHPWANGDSGSSSTASRGCMTNFVPVAHAQFPMKGWPRCCAVRWSRSRLAEPTGASAKLPKSTDFPNPPCTGCFRPLPFSPIAAKL